MTQDRAFALGDGFVAARRPGMTGFSCFCLNPTYAVYRMADLHIIRIDDAKALVRNVSSSDQERTLVDRIKQLDRFKALYFCEGKKKAAYLVLPP